VVAYRHAGLYTGKNQIGEKPVDSQKPPVDISQPGTEEWPCEAYGVEGQALGLLCFFSGYEWDRSCDTRDQCHIAMTLERQRVFDVIHEKAREGDEVSAYLATQFTSPEQLLGGGELQADEDVPEPLRFRRSSDGRRDRYPNP
jgi:hypothetical protein